MRRSVNLNWMNEPLCHLAAYIVGKHHMPLRDRVRRLLELDGSLRTVCTTPRDRKLLELVNVLAHELHLHVLRQEQVVFPYIALLEEVARSSRPLPEPFFGSVRRLVEQVKADSSANLALIARIEHLLQKEPVDSLTLQLGEELKQLQAELTVHLRLESDVLFARAVALEQTLENVQSSTLLRFPLLGNDHRPPGKTPRPRRKTLHVH